MEAEKIIEIMNDAVVNSAQTIEDLFESLRAAKGLACGSSFEELVNGLGEQEADPSSEDLRIVIKEAFSKYRGAYRENESVVGMLPPRDKFPDVFAYIGHVAVGWLRE